MEKQYQHDLNENMSDDKEEMSREDRTFMEIIEKSVSFKYGHYTLKLPFKDSEGIMSNNICIAKPRLLGIKRRYEKDVKFQQEYADFLNDMANQGCAEKVPEHQLNRCEGKIWYLPHHGVYHLRKGKLCVVFDCGAEYKGTSFNSQLLQGPDLTQNISWSSSKVQT